MLECKYFVTVLNLGQKQILASIVEGSADGLNHHSYMRISINTRESYIFVLRGQA